MIKAVHILRKQNVNVNVFIAGSGEEEDELKRLVHSYDLNSSVHFLGHISDRNVISSYYKKCKFVVTPSRWDNDPFAPMDGAIFEKPTIVTKSAHSSITIHGESGYVINDEDYLELGKYISLLLSNDELCRKLGKNAREKVEERSWDNISKKFAGIYRNLHEQFYESVK